MSFLSAFGNDVKKVFGWLGSPKGQAIIRTGEAVVEAIDPALDGVVTLTNTWLQEIYKAQALAVAAAAGSTGGTQKSAMVLNAMTPQVLAFLKTQGLAPANSAQLQVANDALVAFLNALGGTATSAATTSTATTASVTATATGAIPTAYAATQLP